MKIREILEKLTVSASVKTVNIMLDPKENKDIRIYVDVDINQALASLAQAIRGRKKDETKCECYACRNDCGSCVAKDRNCAIEDIARWMEEEK
jgi:hypothetical protein